MEIEYSTLLMNWINIALLIAIVFAVIKGIKEFKNFINRTKQMDQKLDIILDNIEKTKDTK